MTMRDLTGPTQGRAIRDLLQGLLIAEILQPSDPLWILSGWISDVPLLDNRAGQFSGAVPSWPQTWITLSGALHTLVRKGGSIAIVLREVEHNLPFINRMAALSALFPGQVRVAATASFHEKGIVGSDYDISGSMNLTHSGIQVNDEHLIYRTDPSIVAERRITLDLNWAPRFHAPN